MKAAIPILLIVLLSLTGCVGKMQEESNGKTTVSKNEYREIVKIHNYHYGVEAGLKKRMLLSEIARHYALENDYPIDSTAPVVMISYEEKNGGFEVYCIGRTDPWALNVSDVTRLELLGHYIVAYSIPGEDTLSSREIRHFGVNIDCPTLTVHESCWFVFLSSDMSNYYIVKNVFSKDEGLMELRKYLESA